MSTRWYAAFEQPPKNRNRAFPYGMPSNELAEMTAIGLTGR